MGQYDKNPSQALALQTARSCASMSEAPTIAFKMMSLTPRYGALRAAQPRVGPGVGLAQCLHRKPLVRVGDGTPEPPDLKPAAPEKPPRATSPAPKRRAASRSVRPASPKPAGATGTSTPSSSGPVIKTLNANTATVTVDAEWMQALAAQRVSECMHACMAQWRLRSTSAATAAAAGAWNDHAPDAASGPHPAHRRHAGHGPQREWGGRKRHPLLRGLEVLNSNWQLARGAGAVPTRVLMLSLTVLGLPELGIGGGVHLLAISCAPLSRPHCEPTGRREESRRPETRRHAVQRAVRGARVAAPEQRGPADCVQQGLCPHGVRVCCLPAASSSLPAATMHID